jgi:hypothetical protein
LKRSSQSPGGVFERESAIGGNRFRINAIGSRALRCPDPVFETLTNDVAEPSRSLTFFDYRFSRLLAMLRHRRQLEVERPIDRKILCRLLLGPR